MCKAPTGFFLKNKDKILTKRGWLFKKKKVQEHQAKRFKTPCPAIGEMSPGGTLEKKKTLHAKFLPERVVCSS